MTGTGEHLQPSGTRIHPKGFLNPYLQILLGALLITASEVFLKMGATQTATASQYVTFSGIVAALFTGWVWLSILCYIGSFICWLHVLRFVPLNIAFNLTNIVHVFIPLSSWIFLNENISPTRWLGISLVLVGIWIIAKPLVKMEQRL